MAKKRKSVETSTEAASTPNSKVKRSLRNIVEVPLDVLFEIFTFVGPHDLIRLSRTSKQLRGYLTIRSSAWIWKASRINTGGLPELPPSLTEIGFAHLLFEPVCQFCKTAKVYSAIWSCFLRCCKNCLDGPFKLLADLPIKSLPDNIRALAPSHVLNSTKPAHWRGVDLVFHASSALDLYRDYTEVSSKTEGQKQEWIALRQNQQKATVQLAEACVQWDIKRVSLRDQELSDARSKRFSGIVQRLRDAGWKEELAKITVTEKRALRELKVVNQPKEMTNRIWLNVASTLEEHMQGVKRRRLERERIALCRKRLEILDEILDEYGATCSRGYIVPRGVDLALNEPFRSIIEAPVDQGALREHFEGVLSDIPSIADKAHERQVQVLVRLAQARVGSGSKEDLLHRATTVFRCDSIACYGSTHVYPDILRHRCPSRTSLPSKEMPPWITELPWNNNSNIGFSSPGARQMASLLDCCKLDHTTTTFDDLQDLNPLIECLDCREDTYGRAVIRWPQLIESSHWDHHISTTTLSEADRELVLSKEKPRKISKNSTRLRCKHCNFEGLKKDVERHLSKNIHEGALSNDWETVTFMQMTPVCQVYIHGSQISMLEQAWETDEESEEDDG